MTTNALATVQYKPTEIGTERLGSIMVRSGFFKDLRAEAQAVVKILYGRELLYNVTYADSWRCEQARQTGPSGAGSRDMGSLSGMRHRTMDCGVASGTRIVPALRSKAPSTVPSPTEAARASRPAAWGRQPVMEGRSSPTCGRLHLRAPDGGRPAPSHGGPRRLRVRAPGSNGASVGQASQ